jgi:hypothetical protein
LTMPAVDMISLAFIVELVVLFSGFEESPYLCDQNQIRIGNSVTFKL